MKRIIIVFLTLSLVLSFPTIKANAEISISAAAAIVVNAATGEVLYSQNGAKKLPMASTTKIMTAILLLENADLDKEITTTTEMVTVEGSSMGLLPGDIVSYNDLLYGMMLPSGNDAATTVAISLGGSLEGFSIMMNKKAAELRMDNTNFVTPSGLDNKLHYSTVEDMAKLSVYAMKNEIFRKVVSTKEISVEYGNPPYRRMLYGHNKLLDNYTYATGIKTGYTSKSGRCLVSAAKKGDSELIAVTLNDSNTVSSHTALLDYGFSLLQEQALELPYEFSKIPVISGQRSNAKLKVNTRAVALSAAERESLEYKINLKPFVYAPIKKDTKVGNIEFFTKNGKIAELDILIKNTVKMQTSTKKSFLQIYIENLVSLIN